MTRGHFQCVRSGDSLFALIQGFLVHGKVLRFVLTPELVKAVELQSDTSEVLVIPFSDLYRTREAALFSLVHFYESRAQAIRAMLPANCADGDLWE